MPFVFFSTTVCACKNHDCSFVLLMWLECAGASIEDNEEVNGAAGAMNGKSLHCVRFNLDRFGWDVCSLWPTT